jgi:prolyl-tRNA synthetase
MFIMLPLAVRVLDKIERIVDEEMESVGARKTIMPTLLSSEAWRKTGRWEDTGKELFRLKDRKDVDFCLAPTHEEIFTQLVAETIRSESELPLCLYQIGTKYRDEARPRFGLLRGREFVMKDAYSFHITESDALSYYREMESAYLRVFERLQRPIVQVEADGGTIGDSLTHEFQMLSSVGEDTILSCENCGYAANEERAERASSSSRASDTTTHLIFTKNDAGERNHVATLRCGSDREPNPLSINQVLGSNAVSNIDDDLSIVQERDLKSNEDVLMLLDDTCNDDDGEGKTGQFTFSAEGDTCGKCQGAELKSSKGIEVGQIFYLGDKYSKTLGAVVGKKKQPMLMGCYGIGISRIMAALVDTSYRVDEKSKTETMVWPESVAPYVVNVITATKSETSRDAATDLCELLAESNHNLRGEIVLDDRWNARLGMKLTETELIGYPFTVIIGRKYENEGLVEIRDNTNQTSNLVKFSDVPASISSLSSLSS